MFVLILIAFDSEGHISITNIPGFTERELAAKEGHEWEKMMRDMNFKSAHRVVEVE